MFLSLKDVLDDMIQEMRIGAKLNEMKVRKYWHELMGSYITKHTKSIYYKNGKLFVYVESAALKHELFMARDKIKDKLNEQLAQQLIQEVIIK